jgi:hypothetical protein
MYRKFVFGSILISALSGCAASGGEFPSLSRRPFESGTPIEAPVVAPVPVASDLPDAFARQVGALQSRHNKAAASYAAMLPAALQVANAARGSMMGSEAWVNAHVVISRLDHARADSVAALGELDNLVAKRFDAEADGAFPLIMPLLSPIQSDMAASVASQNAEIERLSLIVGL